MRTEAKSRAGAAFICVGCLLIACSALLFFRNRLADERAGKESAEIAGQIRGRIEEEAAFYEEDAAGPTMFPAVYRTRPDVEMPAVDLDGQSYVGVVTIPALGLDLPVFDEWSYDRLKTAPCRYSGSVYRGDMVIAAHNYKTHFGRLQQLTIGDDVFFTDADGNEFAFAVAAVEILSPQSVAAMKESGWDLTLFTCTYGGRYRVTVRCEEKTGIHS